MLLKRHFAGPTEGKETKLEDIIIKERAAFAALAEVGGPDRDLAAVPSLTQSVDYLTRIPGNQR